MRTTSHSWRPDVNSPDETNDERSFGEKSMRYE